MEIILGANYFNLPQHLRIFNDNLLAIKEFRKPDSYLDKLTILKFDHFLDDQLKNLDRNNFLK